MNAAMPTSMPLRHILLALFSVMVLGINVVAIKVAVTYVPPLFVTALRFSLVGLVLVWFFPVPRGQWRNIFIFSIAQGLLHHGIMFIGMTEVDAAVGAIVMQLCTPFAALMAWGLLGEHFGWRRTVGIAVSLLGVAVLAGEPEVKSATLYIGILLLSAAAWGYANIHVKRMGTINILQITAWMSLFAAPELFVASAIWEQGQWAALMSAPNTMWVSLLYMSLGATVIAYGIWYKLLARYDVVQIVPFALLNPVTAVAAGVLLLDESLAWQKIVGGIIVLAGVTIIQVRWRRAVVAAD